MLFVIYDPEYLANGHLPPELLVPPVVTQLSELPLEIAFVAASEAAFFIF